MAAGAGELELENRGEVLLEITHTLTPLQHLDLMVVDPDGMVVSEGHYSDRFSPTREPQVLRLGPGETFSAPVALLGTVPSAKRRSGVYQVHATYEFAGFAAQAEPIEVVVS